MKTAKTGTATRPAIDVGGDLDEIRLAERVIAVVRILLASTALFVLRLDPTPSSQYGVVIPNLFLAYAVFAMLLLAALLRARSIPRWLPISIQAVDVAFAAALTMFSAGPASPLDTFLYYPLLAAAYRWGFREVMVVAALIDVFLAVEVLYVGLPPAGSLAFVGPSSFDLNILILRVLYVGVAGAVLGYLAESQKRRSFETRATSEVLTRVRLDGRLGDTVNLVLDTIRRLFKADGVVIVIEEQPSGRILRWATGKAAADHEVVRPDPVPETRRGDYLFDAPGTAWHASTRWAFPARGRFTAVALDENGRRLPASSFTLPEGFLAAHPCRRLVGATLPLGDDWSCRLFVLGPGLGVHREQNARFALRLARAVGPVLYGHYLLRRVRTDSQALERRRIARELHDGVTQSLLGLEMEIVVLRRRAMAEAPQFTEDLSRVHGIVRNEVITVRELMEGIRVGDLDAGDLPQHLGDVVDRFSRHTGIAARFVSDGRTVALSPNTCRQVARIVHEALVNVRKHSAADHVLVRADVDGASWNLSIEDDGRGFQFAGRLSQEELEKARQGPRTIGERVRLIGGMMTVESRPGFGARVEIAVPLQGAS